MEGNISIKDVVLDRKLKEYCANDDNFIAAQEITVTITLKEYRELVSISATAKADIDKANNDKFAREQTIKKLTEEVSNLKAENYELRKKVGNAEVSKE